MAKWINMVETFCCDYTKEDEFNHFYNETHLPDVLKTPGFVSARRYVHKEPRNGRGKYLAIYEIDSNNINETMAIRRNRREEEKVQGRSASKTIPGLLLSVWSDVLYEQIYEVSSGGPGRNGNWLNMVELLLTSPSLDKEFNDAYNTVHLHDILRSPGFLTAKRFFQKEPCNGRGDYLAIYEIETDDIDQTMARRRELRIEETKHGRALGKMVPNSFLPVWQDVQFKKMFELSNE